MNDNIFMYFKCYLKEDFHEGRPVLLVLVIVMNSCAQACVHVWVCVWVDGINHPCGFLVISTERLFTLITSFPKHRLTQKENFAGVDILFAGVQLQGMHTDTEWIFTFLVTLPKPVCPLLEKIILFVPIELNPALRSVLFGPFCWHGSWHAYINLTYMH